MPRSYFSLKFKYLLLFVIAIQLGVTGCGLRALPATYDSIRFTDKDVVEFNNRLTVMMQNNRNWNSIMRYSTSVVALGAVASAGALGIAGVSANVIGYITLGGGFVGTLQGIFKTRERASAYQQGIDLLYEAHNRYLHSLAKDSSCSTADNSCGLIDESKNSGWIPNDQLTKSAANLYTESIASLKLVEKALISQIPTAAEIQKAKGEYKKFSVFPETISFSAFPESGDATLDVMVMEGGPILSISSGNSAVIEAKLEQGNGNKVTLKLLTRKNLDKMIEVKLMNAQGVDTIITITPDTTSNGTEEQEGENPLKEAEKQVKAAEENEEKAKENLKTAQAQVLEAARQVGKVESTLNSITEATAIADAKKKVQKAEKDFKMASEANARAEASQKLNNAESELQKAKKR